MSTLQNIRWLILQEKSLIIVEVRTDLQKLDLKISQLEVGTIFNYNGAFYKFIYAKVKIKNSVILFKILLQSKNYLGIMD